MEIPAAVEALNALAHETRLRVFRVLVEGSPQGFAAGLLAERLEVAPSTLSFHLAHLVRAGLVESERDGRAILYSLRVDGLRDLQGFITHDCCQGQPALCMPPAVSRRRGRKSRA